MSIIARLRRIRRRSCSACAGRTRVWNPPVGAISCPVCHPGVALPAWANGEERP